MLKQTTGFFKGFEGFELFFQRWQKGNAPRLTLIITHGLGEHSDAYNRLVSGLDIDEVEIYGWDLRGHGHSDGRWGVVESFDHYSKDLSKFIEFVKEEKRKSSSTGPLFLVSHSMGGLVTMRMLLQEKTQGIDGVVLSSPLMGVAVAVPPLKEKLGRFVARYVPNLTLYNEIEFEDLTRDREVIKEYERDTLRHDRVSVGLYLQLNETMAWCLQNTSSFQYPVLIQQAGADHVVSAAAAEKLFSLLPSKDKELIVYENYYHEIYNDIGRERAYSDLKKWLLAHA